MNDAVLHRAVRDLRRYARRVPGHAKPIDRPVPPGDNSGIQVLISIIRGPTALSTLANRACRHQAYPYLDLALPRHCCGTLVLLQIVSAIPLCPRSGNPRSEDVIY